MEQIIRQGDYRDALGGETWDALIVDAPYSDRTHTGHRGGVSADDGRARRDLHYASLSPEGVGDMVDFLAPRTRGWMVSITDHMLSPAWAAAMERHGRYVFAPLVWYAPGSRVRIAGDGPSCWVCWIVVSRPRTREFARWGTLPGGYAYSQDRGGWIGGKPLALMRALVADYSRPGDRICDPCCGGGTTLVAARVEGRAAIGCDVDPDAVAETERRLAASTATAIQTSLI